MHRVIVVAAILAWCSGVAMAGINDGLVAYYPFDEGKGAVAHDRSDHGNDGKITGGAEWVKGDFGSALSFDGTDDWIDCGAGESLNISSGGTVMIWSRPRKIQGCLINWRTGGAGFVVRLNSYHSGNRTGLSMRDDTGEQKSRGFGPLPTNEWTHLAYTFDGENVLLYRNGLLTASQWRNGITEQRTFPDIKGIPLLLGRSGGGKGFFHGMLDEVRVYNRALSGKEIASLYKQDATGRGKDLTVFTGLGLAARSHPDAGKVVLKLDARGLAPFPDGAVLKADLLSAKGDKPLAQAQTTDILTDYPSEVIFNIPELPAGTYRIRASAIGPNDKRIGKQSSITVEWPGRPEYFKNIKVLNNLCWELVNASPADSEKYTFSLPYDRWIFVRSIAAVGADGEVTITVDTDRKEAAAIVHHYLRGGREKEYDNKPKYPERKPHETTYEAMRFLKAGEHTIYVGRSGKAEVKQIVVRAIPALHYAVYGGMNWDDFKKEIMPNVNVMIGGLEYYPAGDALVRLEEWNKTGRQWLSYKWVPYSDRLGFELKTTKEYYEYWACAIGYQHPLTDGILGDEFIWGDNPIYDTYRQSVEMLNARFPGKGFYPWVDSLYGAESSIKFIQACLDGGGYICWERYFSEVPGEKFARDDLQRRLTDRMLHWEDAIPGCTPRVVATLSYLSELTRGESGNRLPTANYKAFMDMQVNALANHPNFFGLGGIQWYLTVYANEEHRRFAVRQFRHYAIEGNTNPINDDPYDLTHIRNPDFVGGTAGWDIQPAEQGSIQTKTFRRLGRIQARWPDAPYGDTFLVMKRSANKPNKFSQEIKDLKPGKVYSMKLITGDYQDLIQEKSERKTHAISIELDNVDILPGPENSYVRPYRNSSSHGKFKGGYRYFFNYHWRVFRAKSETAKLTVTDWANDTEPGGPVGQELLYNFIEIEPYMLKGE